jgi:hypothetical protein
MVTFFMVAVMEEVRVIVKTAVIMVAVKVRVMVAVKVRVTFEGKNWIIVTVMFRSVIIVVTFAEINQNYVRRIA